MYRFQICTLSPLTNCPFSLVPIVPHVLRVTGGGGEEGERMRERLSSPRAVDWVCHEVAKPAWERWGAFHAGSKKQHSHMQQQQHVAVLRSARGGRGGGPGRSPITRRPLFPSLSLQKLAKFHQVLFFVTISPRALGRSGSFTLWGRAGELSL